MATWPTRGQQAPDFWDVLLKEYIDEGIEGAVTPERVAEVLDQEPLKSDLAASAGVVVSEFAGDPGTRRVQNRVTKPRTGDPADWFANSFGTGGNGTKTVEAGMGFAGSDRYVMKWTTASTATGTNTGPQIEPVPALRTAVAVDDISQESVWLDIADLHADMPNDAVIYARQIIKDAGGNTYYTGPGDLFTCRKGRRTRIYTRPHKVTQAGFAHINLTVWTAADMGTGMLAVSARQNHFGTSTVPYRDGTFPDARWIGSPFVSASESAPARYDRLVLWGDSHFGAASGGGYTLDKYLADLMPGIEIVNAGRAGETATGISVRAGATPLLVTLTGNQIPASTASTTATVSPSTTFRTDGGTSFPQRGELAGVGGVLGLADGVWSFTPDIAPASPVSVPPGSLFTPHGVHRGADLWVFMGGNNLHSTQQQVDDINTATDNFVAEAQRLGIAYCIISLLNNKDEPSGSNGYINLEKIMAHREKNYPGKVIDLRRFLIDQGLATLGISPTAGDITAIAQDRIPESLLDAPTTLGVHLTPTARQYIHAGLISQWVRRNSTVSPDRLTGVTKSFSQGAVTHNGDAIYPRPDTYGQVVWKGWVYPLNALSGDVWLERAAPLATLLAAVPCDALYLASSLALADGATVSTWPDSSGNGRTLSPAAWKVNNAVYAAASATFGGAPSVVFNQSAFVSAAFAKSQALTLIQVATMTTVGSQGLGASASGRPKIYRASPNGELRMNAGSTLQIANTALASPHLVVAKFNGASSTGQQDGGTAVVGAAGSGTVDLITLGGYDVSTLLTGEVNLAMIPTAGALSADQLANVNRYVKDTTSIGTASALLSIPATVRLIT